MHQHTNFRSIDGTRLEAFVTTSHDPNAGLLMLVHGITADLNEGGMYRRFADQAMLSGFHTFRFSFRAHGQSEGVQEGMTIAGEMMDFLSSYRHVESLSPSFVVVLASSFGAVSVLESLGLLSNLPKKLVLWNPVLDLRDTFLQPHLPWGVDNFANPDATGIYKNGFLVIDSNFRLGLTVWREFEHYKPYLRLRAVKIPTLIVHGEQDSSVSYDISRREAQSNDHCTFLSVDSDHGFSPQSMEDFVIRKTLAWITSINS